MSGKVSQEVRSRLDERDQRMIQMMLIGYPTTAIAKLEGLDQDYCRKICAKLSKDNQIVHVQRQTTSRVEAPVGLTDASRRMRSRLADHLHELSDLLDNDLRRVSGVVGLNLRDQKYAKERPFNHDWTLSQIERLAKGLDVNFSELLDATRVF